MYEFLRPVLETNAALKFYLFLWREEELCCHVTGTTK